ncbi:MAG: hypothetical protein AAAC47_06000 [Pararhizobium sp.]
MSAAAALQKAIYGRLAGDAALIALIGDGGVRDHLQTGSHRPGEPRYLDRERSGRVLSSPVRPAAR